MTFPQRLATIAIHASMEDPKFNQDAYINRREFYKGYEHLMPDIF